MKTTEDSSESGVHDNAKYCRLFAFVQDAFELGYRVQPPMQRATSSNAAIALDRPSFETSCSNDLLLNARVHQLKAQRRLDRLRRRYGIKVGC